MIRNVFSITIGVNNNNLISYEIIPDSYEIIPDSYEIIPFHTRFIGVSHKIIIVI